MKVTSILGIFPMCVVIINGWIITDSHNAEPLNTEIKRAFLSPTVRAAPATNQHGHFQFRDQEEVDFSLEGVLDKRILLTKKSDINPQKPEVARIKKRREQSMVYQNQEHSMLCRKDCSVDTNDCEFYCSMTGQNTGYYIGTSGRALAIGTRGGGVGDAVPPPKPPKMARGEDSLLRELEDMVDNVGRKFGTSRKFSETGLLKLIVVPDREFMNRFLDYVDGDVEKAKKEVTKFVTLSVNEMTIAFQSLKNYGLEMNIKGNQRILDVAVYLADIVFPEINANKDGFINPIWSEESLVDGIMQFRFDGGIGYNKGLESFRKWIINYTTSVRYDHAMALTGFPVNQIVNDRKYYPDGVSWIGTTCDQGSKTTGYHTSLLTLYGAQGRLMAHEVAHGLGAQHDGSSECPSKAYIMSSNTPIPSDKNIHTYYTFSPCSARNIRDFLDRIQSYDFVWTCLYDSNLSDNQFLEAQCDKGLKGDYLTLDMQCQQTFGTESFVCNPKGTLISNNYVTRCHREGADDHPVFCNRSSDGECVPIIEVADGTKCTLNGRQGTNICFKGKCVTDAEVCKRDTDLDAPTPTTTPPPTTTTTPDQQRRQQHRYLHLLQQELMQQVRQQQPWNRQLHKQQTRE